MKKVFLAAYLFPGLSLSAQVPIYVDCYGSDLPAWTITFEDTAYWDRVGIDTAVSSGNGWHIGKPNKSFCSAAYSGVNCLITDTVANYPSNTRSEAQLVLDIHAGGSWWVQMSGRMKFETDSLRDGGTIEYSEDGGITWRNVAEDALFYTITLPYTINDTVEALNVPGISGSSGNSWVYFDVLLSSWWSVEVLDTFQVRFVFASDSIADSLGGWAIDDLYFFGLCSGIDEYANTHFSLFPNPSTGMFYIEEDFQNRPVEISVCNNFGEMVHVQDAVNREVDLSFLPDGIYMLLVRSGSVMEHHKVVILH